MKRKSENRSAVRPTELESEARYRQLCESMRDAFVSVDMKGWIRECNQAYREMLGYSESELLKMTYLELTPESWHDYEANIVEQEILPQGYSRVYEKEYRRKDGTVFPVELKRGLLRDEQGGPVGMWAMVRDISKRRRAESVLQQRTAEIRAMLEAVPDPIFRLDREGVILDFKPGKGFVTLVPPEQFLGRRLSEVLPNDLAGAVVQHLERTLDSGEKTVFEYQMPIGDGMGHFEARCAVCGEDEVLAIVRDITERKQAEETVAESRRELSTLLANLPGMAYRCRNDPDWTMEFVSDGCRDLTGLNPAELVGSKKLAYAELIHPDDRDAVWEGVQQALEKRTSYELVYRIQAGGEREKWVWEKGRGVFSSQRELRFLEGFITDISERKRAEDILKVSEERFRVLARVSPVGIFRNDFEGRCVYANEKCCEIVGLPQEKVIGWRWLEALHPDDLEQVRTEWSRAATEKEPFEMEYRFLHQDGEVVWVVGNAAPLGGPSGEVIGHIGSITDITKLKETIGAVEDARQELQNLTRKLQVTMENERSRIARDIHDDLGQTLTALKMDTYLLRKQVGKNRKALKRLDDMSRLIEMGGDTLRAISAELRPSMLDDFGLAASVRWQFDQFQRRFGIKGRLVDELPAIELDDDVTVGVFRIFQEALTNVARHAKATHVKVRMKLENDRLFMTVHDNGRGLSKELISNRNATGLVGMRERTRLLGGDFSAEGKPGEGTIVSLSVPVVPVIRSD